MRLLGDLSPERKRRAELSPEHASRDGRPHAPDGDALDEQQGGATKYLDFPLLEYTEAWPVGGLNEAERESAADVFGSCAMR